MLKIDKIDKKILYLMDVNSKQSYSQIAEKTGLHKSSIEYRLKKLEKLGVIKNYFTVIDSFKLGYSCYRVYIKLQYANDKKKKEIIDYFVNNDYSGIVAKIDFKYDLKVLFWINDINSFYSFYEEIHDKYGSYILDIKLSNYMKMITYRPRYLLDENNHCEERVFDVIGGGNKIEINDLDLKLLKIISSNSRITFVDIAKQLKCSPKIVIKSFHKLKDIDVIKGFRINIDYSKIGYMLFKLDIFLKDFKIRNRIIEYVKCNPNLWAICFTAGHSHLEFEFHLKNIYQIKKIMNDIFVKYPNAIKNYDFFIIRDHAKYLWLI